MSQCEILSDTLPPLCSVIKGTHLNGVLPCYKLTWLNKILPKFRNIELSKMSIPTRYVKEFITAESGDIKQCKTAEIVLCLEINCIEGQIEYSSQVSPYGTKNMFLVADIQDKFTIRRVNCRMSSLK